MIKKIIWTIILLAPGVLTIIVGLVPGNVFHNGDDAFNYSGAIRGWTKFFEDLIVVINSDGRRSFVEVILPLFIAIFWTSPFWYAWKGTFFLRLLPIRIIFLLLLFLMPQIMQWISLLPINDSWKPDAIFYTNLVLIIVSLLGLWLKS